MKDQILAFIKTTNNKDKLLIAVDLVNTDQLLFLFGKCKINAAYITADGWDFIFDFYEKDTLVLLAQKSCLVEDKDDKVVYRELIYLSLFSWIQSYHPGKRRL